MPLPAVPIPEAAHPLLHAGSFLDKLSRYCSHGFLGDSTASAVPLGFREAGAFLPERVRVTRCPEQGPGLTIEPDCLGLILALRLHVSPWGQGPSQPSPVLSWL